MNDVATPAAPATVFASRRSFRLARAGMAVVAAAQGEIGVWGLVAPRSFYASYPGGGMHWVAAMGPYDEHLVRDFAAMELGFAVLLACAAIWFERRLVLVAGAAFLAATIPHFAYHLTTTGMLPAAQDAASLGGFALELAVVAAAMVAVRPPTTRTTRSI